jgi:peptidoglycan/xylan/chitin deacetylase (PgdA/CDA1 family)
MSAPAGTSLSRLLSPGIRLAGSLACREAAGCRLAIVYYHRVLAQPDPLQPDVFDAAIFARHLAVLSRDFRVIPLADAASRLRAGTLPPRSAVITFDDGYGDNFHVALPMLRHYGLSATFFVATGYLDGGAMFNDVVIEACRQAPAGAWETGVDILGTVQVSDDHGRRHLLNDFIAKLKYLEPAERMACARKLLATAQGSIPADLMMRREEVLALHRAGMTIGGHTRSHPILSRLGPEDALADIADGRADLQDITGGPVDTFAYPNGRPGIDYGAREVALVAEAGFSLAVSTMWGAARPGSSVWELPRIGSWDRTEPRFAARLLQAYRAAPA